MEYSGSLSHALYIFHFLILSWYLKIKIKNIKQSNINASEVHKIVHFHFNYQKQDMLWFYVIGVAVLGMIRAQHPGPVVSTMSGDVQGRVMYDSQGRYYLFPSHIQLYNYRSWLHFLSTWEEM